MSGASNHPEALLELAAQGKLTREHSIALQRHARECEACSAHLHALRDFRDELATGDFDSLLDARAIEGALAATRSRPAQKTPRSRWLAGAAATLAALLLTGAVLARWGASLGTSVKRPVATAQASAPPLSKPAPSALTAHPETQAAEPPARTLRSSAGARPAPSRKEVEPAPPAPRSAAELFGRANELRRAGKDSDAVQTYLELQSSFPASREALLSHAIAGHLLLEQGRPESALAQFDSYLKRGAAVTEDALAGRAAALQRLGRGDEERTTWETLLRRFPRSVHATRARARVAQLQQLR